MNDIRLDHISKSFTGGKQLFSDISFSVRFNETVCLFGPSGCGKTTILHILAGLTVCDGGNISFGDTDMPHPTRIGYVFQDSRLLPWLTVGDNIRVVLEGVVSSEGQEDRIRQSLAIVQMSQCQDRMPGSLSGGERQRVALARALSIRPQVLLLDEPFSHLDELTAMQLRSDFLNVKKREPKTTIFATHNPLEAIYLADTIIVLTSSVPTRIRHVIPVRRTVSRTKHLYHSMLFLPQTKRILKKLLG